MKRLLLFCVIATSCIYVQAKQPTYTINTDNNDTTCTITILDDLSTIKRIGNFKYRDKNHEITWPCIAFLKEHTPVLITARNKANGTPIIYNIKGLEPFTVSKEKLADVYKTLLKDFNLTNELMGAIVSCIGFTLVGICILAAGWKGYCGKGAVNQQRDSLMQYFKCWAAPTDPCTICCGSCCIAIANAIFGTTLITKLRARQHKQTIKEKETAFLDTNLVFIKKQDLDAFKKAIPTFVCQELSDNHLPLMQ